MHFLSGNELKHACVHMTRGNNSKHIHACELKGSRPTSRLILIEKKKNPQTSNWPTVFCSCKGPFPYTLVTCVVLVRCYTACHVVVELHVIHGIEGEHHSLRSLDRAKAELEGNSHLWVYGNRLAAQSFSSSQVLFTWALALLPWHE